jgi:hypothetical protein
VSVVPLFATTAIGLIPASPVGGEQRRLEPAGRIRRASSSLAEQRKLDPMPAAFTARK